MSWAKPCGNKECKVAVMVDFISLSNLERNGHQNNMAPDIVFCTTECFLKFAEDLKERVKNGSAEREPKMGDRQMMLCAKTGEMTPMHNMGTLIDYGSGHVGWQCIHGNKWGHRDEEEERVQKAKR